MIIVAGSHTDKNKEAAQHIAEGRLKRRRAFMPAETLDDIEWSNPGLIVTDLEFEGIEGLELVRRIRKKNKEKYQQVPILALVENASPSHIEALLTAGVSDILLCPYDPAALRIRAVRGRDQNYAGILRGVDPETARDLPEQPTQKDLDELLLRVDALKDDSDPVIMIRQRDEAQRRARELSSVNQKPILSYDFKHPARVSKDQMRTIENLHTNFARMMASAFSTFARQIVDVDIAFVDQTTYGEFIRSLSNPSVSYTWRIEPLGGPAVLDFSTPIAYSFIERQFGGAGGRRPQDLRPLTAIERTVMTQVVFRCLADLEAMWEPLMPIQSYDAELETNPEFMQVAAPSDTVVLIAFEVNFQKARGLINLCYPYFTLEPAMSLFNVQTWASSRRNRRRQRGGYRQDRLDQLKTIDAEVTAFAGYGKLSADQLAALNVGDTLLLDTRVTDPGIVFVENVPTFYGTVGLGESENYAVEITKSIPIEEARKYAKQRTNRNNP